MSFSGKKFRRIATENLDVLLKSDKNLHSMLKNDAPIFSYTKVDVDTFSFLLTLNEEITTFTFKLDQEIEVKRMDGLLIKIVYTLVENDILHQKMTAPDGKIVHFRKRLSEKDPQSTIWAEGSSAQAKVFYEIVK